MDIKTQRILTQDNMDKKLYVLENHLVMAFYSSNQQVVDDDAWNQRLGHANPHILQLLKSNKVIISNKESSSSIC